MKPKRPYTPIAVKIVVAARQMREQRPDQWRGILYGLDEPMPGHVRLCRLLQALGIDPTRAELHHTPALGLRAFNSRTGRWKPDANDPEHMVYLDAAAHLEQTAGRGGTSMRVGGDTRAVAKARRIVREGKMTVPLGLKPARRKTAKSSGLKIPARKNPWPKGRKFQQRRPPT